VITRSPTFWLKQRIHALNTTGNSQGQKDNHVIKTLQAPGLDAYHNYTWHNHSQQNTHANNRNLTTTS
jgi:hypothetical protein